MSEKSASALAHIDDAATSCASPKAVETAPPVCRRAVLKSIAILASPVVAACTSSCGGGGSESDSGSAGSPPPSSPSPPPPAPPPAPTPAPPPTSPIIGPRGAYRNTQPYLFASVLRGKEPARVAGGDELLLDVVGPHREYADFGSGWKWTNAGGDWIDANGVRMGSTPWGEANAQAVAGAVTYQVDVAAALQYVFTQGRWNAWLVRRSANGPRTVAGRFHETDAYRPRIEVVYTDGASATLACRVSAFMGNGNSRPSQSAPTYPMSSQVNTGEIALEFDLPAKAVRSATMFFTVLDHWGANNRLLFDLADPPLNGDAVRAGIADGYALDNGLSSHPSIIGQHRYHDGSQRDDYFFSGTVLNTELASSYDPALWGGAPDTDRLPHLGLGKWIGSWGAGGAEIVSSAYDGEGFEPLAPGIGALKVRMDKHPGIADGVEGGQNGTAAANSYIFLPESRFGRQSRIFVRYYMRIGSRHRTPYRALLAEKYHVLKFGVPTWTDMAGKCSIGAAHKTKRGGNSGTAGGGYGWTLRREFADGVQDPNSPHAGGWGNSWSFYDFQNNPPGHNYATQGDRSLHSLGQRGGLGGTLYADRWYCIEEEIKLNSVDQPATVNGAPHLINGVQQFWTPDGEVRCWIDGRLTYERTGMVLRSLPVVAPIPDYLPGIRELGVAHLWFNWFHGGLTRNSIDRVLFIAGLAWGDEYIGPMRT